MPYIIVPLITLATALIGGQFTATGVNSWYQRINKPTWTPPGSVIGLVWTILYILIAISAIRAWNATAGTARFWPIMITFLINAVLNAGWSYLFFTRQSISGAFLEMLVLELSIFVLIGLLWPIDRIAAYLLIPYAAWVGFATFLTYRIWQLN